MNYPINCDTPKKKMSYLLETYERYRRINNALAKWRNDGLTQDEYDNGFSILDGEQNPIMVIIPQKIKDRFPSDLKLSESNFRLGQKKCDNKMREYTSLWPKIKSQIQDKDEWSVLVDDI